VAALLFLSAFYSWRQVGSLRLLTQSPFLPPEERRFRRNQAWRRLAGCGVMLVLALLLAGTLFYLEGPVQGVADERGAAHGAGQDPDFTPEKRHLVQLWGYSWLAILFLLAVLLFVAGFEFWAIRRYSLREYRKIQADRNAMIARQAARLRQERNERN
jgi:hypothetical protein